MKQAQSKFGGAHGPFVTTPPWHGNQDTADATGLVGPSDTLVTEVAYSDEVIADLIYMIEEEKLAGDVYEAFYEMYGLKIFDNIAASEDRHFEALLGQAEALGIDTDVFVFAEAGSFEDLELQALYDELIETGAQSLTSALEVGAAIETKDIVDIAEAIEDVEDTALAGVYANLLAGSESHLVAFEGMLA